MTSDRMTSCQSTHRRTVEDDIIALNQTSNVKQKIEIVGGRTTKKKQESVTEKDNIFFSPTHFSVNHVQFIATHVS